MRREALTTVKGGLNRLRTKGAALKDSLYDLLNGYVTAARTVRVRPGTFLDETLTTGTKGLTAFEGLLHVFGTTLISVPAGYNLNVIKSPTNETLALTKIHFAEPFLGALYVAAEFSDGGVFHYWLQPTSTWAASTEYDLFELVEPTVPDGFSYQANRLGAPFPAWTPNAPRTIGDIIEPTVYSGYFFTVDNVFGTSPRSGDIEPIWPTNAGAIIIEDTDDTSNAPSATPPSAPSIPDLPDDINERYDIHGNQI